MNHPRRPDSSPMSATDQPSDGSVVRPPRGAYTSWFARLVAFTIDTIPYVVIVVTGIVVEVSTRETLCAADTSQYELGPYCATGNSTLGLIAFLASLAGGFAYLLWNYGYRQGKTGSSLGKSVMKFRVVGEKTGRPIGFARSVVRQLAHAFDGVLCFAGYLLPLFDSKRQTLADKLVKTVCVPRG